MPFLIIKTVKHLVLNLSDLRLCNDWRFHNYWATIGVSSAVWVRCTVRTDLFDVPTFIVVVRAVAIPTTPFIIPTNEMVLPFLASGSDQEDNLTLQQTNSANCLRLIDGKSHKRCCSPWDLNGGCHDRCPFLLIVLIERDALNYFKVILNDDVRASSGDGK